MSQLFWLFPLSVLLIILLIEQGTAVMVAAESQRRGKSGFGILFHNVHRPDSSIQAKQRASSDLIPGKGIGSGFKMLTAMIN